MLEIIALIYISRFIGMKAGEKGHNGNFYKFLFIALWILGEIIGWKIGGSYVSENIERYPFALTGAVIGALIVVAIVSFMKVNHQLAILNVMDYLETYPKLKKNTHFKLACLYSLMNDKINSIIHLDKAVENGCRINKINSEPKLEFVRNLEEFAFFKSNNYCILNSTRFNESYNAKDFQTAMIYLQYCLLFYPKQKAILFKTACLYSLME